MQGKSIIVTGASQGIGLAIAETLLAQHAKISIFDNHTSSILKLNDLRDRYSEDLLVIDCDVSDEASVKAGVAQVLQRFAKIDGLVNNAGIADPDNGPIEKLELATWQRLLDVDLTGPFLMAKHCAKFLSSNKGAIVNIASTRALQSEENTEAYAAAKGGLLSLTHALAISFAHRIRVNAISPGWVVTDDYTNPANHPTKLTQQDHQQHPTGRVGQPTDIANMVAFLISDKAEFITGQNFVVDGGMTKKMVYE